MHFKFDIQLFAEAEVTSGAAPVTSAGGQAAADTGATAPAMQSDASGTAAHGADVEAGAAVQGDRLPWEQVRELYKAEIDTDAKAYAKEYAKGVVERRTSKNKAALDTFDSLKPFLDRELYRRGIKDGDYAALVKATETDKSMFRERAIANDTSEEVEEALYNAQREVNFQKEENERLRAQAEDETRLNEIRTHYRQIEKGVLDIRNTYDPNFDLKTEMATNPVFARYASEPHNSLIDAYKMAHHDDIVARAVASATNDAVTKTANAIKSGTMPVENAVSSGSPVSTKKDPSKLTLDEINQMIAEAGRGIKHDFR